MKEVELWLSDPANDMFKIKDDYGQNPVHIACFKNYVEIVHLFLLHIKGRRKGILTMEIIDEIKDRFRWNPFHHAVLSGNYEVLDIFLQEMGDQEFIKLANQKIEYIESSSLILAAMRRVMMTLKFLVDHKVDMHNCGKPLFHIFAKRKYHKIYDDLLEIDRRNNSNPHTLLYCEKSANR